MTWIASGGPILSSKESFVVEVVEAVLKDLGTCWNEWDGGGIPEGRWWVVTGAQGGRYT